MANMDKKSPLQGRPAPVHVKGPRQHGTPRDTNANPSGRKVPPRTTPGQHGSKKSF